MSQFTPEQLAIVQSLNKSTIMECISVMLTQNQQFVQKANEILTMLTQSPMLYKDLVKIFEEEKVMLPLH